jgi:undecaprenyl-diphosphatase
VIWPSAIQALDEACLAEVRGAPAALVPLFLVATVVGGGWGLLAVVPFAARPATRAATLWLLGAVVATSAAVSTLKALVGRVRPCDALAWCAPVDVVSPGGHSFPSGHAAGSFAFAAFVAVRAPRWAAPALLWAAIVGWSRCVLGVHYPSDVLAGAALGAALGVIFARRSLRGITPPSSPAPAARPSPSRPPSDPGRPGSASAAPPPASGS